jgi:hypothetical protein
MKLLLLWFLSISVALKLPLNSCIIKPIKNNNAISNYMNLVIEKLPLQGITLLLLEPVPYSLAKDGEYGVLEGRTASLIHPVIMLGLFLTTLYR